MADKPRSRPFQYSLRTLFIITTVLAIACSLFAYAMHWMQGNRKIWAAAEKINDAGGEAYCDDLIGGTTPWLYCQQITDAGMVHLKDLKNLEVLYLNHTRITDAGLVHLEGLTNLEYLNLEQTHVTDEGVKKLQEALPDCEIIR